MKIVFNDLIYDLYKEFCRLKGYKIPTAPIEQMVDEATGSQTARMKEFSEWFYEEVISRLDPELLTNESR